MGRGRYIAGAKPRYSDFLIASLLASSSRSEISRSRRRRVSRRIRKRKEYRLK